MNLSPSNSLVPNPLIRAIESCLGSCGIANLAILQLGKFSGGGGKGLSMGWFGLQGHKFMELARLVLHGDMFDYIHGPCVVITFGDLAN
ncbi:hypothetical protein Tco_0233876 [Tanacetum coccineum]